MGNSGVKPNYKRKLAMVSTRLRNPCATLEQIGGKFGVSKERVRQVLSEANAPTKSIRIKNQYHCLNCGKLIQTQGKKFCSHECQHLYSQIPIKCSECGEIFHISKSQLFARETRRKVEGYWCSKQCFGKWLSRNHGFIKHPENRGHAKRKWDYEKIYQIRDITGFGARKIGHILNIPEVTISNILQKRNLVWNK